MFRLLVGIGCFAMLAIGAGCSSSKEEAKHAPVWKADGHFPDGKDEKKYDTAKKADREELVTDLSDPERVHELAKDEPPDIFGLKRWDLGLWSIIIFLILFFALKKFAWKPMIDGLHKREANIQSALDAAEKSRKEAMELHTQVDAKLKAAGGEIAKMMDEGRRDAQMLKDQMVADAKSEIQHDRDRLHREVETAKDQALQEIWQQSVALATAISGKVIRRNLTQDDHQRLLDESLAELKTSGTGIGKRYA
jgi:F-type H+-transporting ATPase subunit b